jgi:deoxycytidylate deaminase
MAELLEKDYGFRRFKISDEITAELSQRGCLKSKGELGWRSQRQDHGNLRRRETLAAGCRYWVDKVIKVIARIDKAGIGSSPVVIDGIRNHHEVEALRRAYFNFFLIAVCAEQKARWTRVKADYGDRWAEFRRDDQRDNSEGLEWGQSVQKCVDHADFVFSNNEQLLIQVKKEEKPDNMKVHRAFKRQIDDYLPLMKGEPHRAPKPEELQIAAAYALSDASSCIKRHVGAVVTVSRGGREFCISTGYNENPQGTRRCIENGGCIKDEHMASWFNAQEKLHCTACGRELHNLSIDSRCECGEALKDWLWPDRGMELCTAIHAEERAVRSLGDRSAENGTLYVTTFPCFQCARMILDAGITRVVYVEAYPSPESKDFLVRGGCEVVPFTGFTASAFFRVFPRVS